MKDEFQRVQLGSDHLTGFYETALACLFASCGCNDVISWSKVVQIALV